MQIHSQAVYVNISPDLPNAADFPKAVEEIVESLGKWSNLKPFFQIGLVQAPTSWKTFGKVWNYGAYRIEGNIWFDQNSHPSGDLRNPHLVQTEGNLFFTLSSDNPWPKSTGLVMSCVCVFGKFGKNTWFFGWIWMICLKQNIFEVFVKENRLAPNSQDEIICYRSHLSVRVCHLSSLDSTRGLESGTKKNHWISAPKRFFVHGNMFAS